MAERKALVSAVVPPELKRELEERARAQNKSIAELLRTFIDQGLHGAPQAAQPCQDNAAEQLSAFVTELLSFYEELYTASWQLHEASKQLNDAVTKQLLRTIARLFGPSSAERKA
jgi:flagellar biosynthesis/type III secretory pathway protein FliH